MDNSTFITGGIGTWSAKLERGFAFCLNQPPVYNRRLRFFPMPAYSSTPLAQKLGFKDHTRYLLVGAPADFRRELPTLPPTARAVTARAAEADLIVFFAADLKTLMARCRALAAKLPAAGALWIAWPKMSSGVPTDLREGLVREALLKTGLVDIKVCSINDTWSGLKFVRRLKDRA
jgi:hypothetical protein